MESHGEFNSVTLGAEADAWRWEPTQDIAPRLALEVERLAYGENVTARGPELVSTSFDAASSTLTVTLSNASLSINRGVVVPPPAGGCSSTGLSPAVAQVNGASATPVPFTITGNTVAVKCKTGGGDKAPVLINGDAATCFLYSSVSGLPAPPLALPCQ